ncbi:acetate--CoA ligase family protein [Umezawaea sp. Da 62-37]|uniref:acetate--CoA ligase family protein n=1 Tax=Umezawaea sp. Da 62-37 TaxID=3075927 RepID=UPI0028F6C8A3|nr:acetate--CoA ligase family protein [Umezawaea sp. Da 62-37]WNV88251.1 acetate--CoA ligase family protein [Umezawaea sp. Da 62-37]
MSDAATFAPPGGLAASSDSTTADDLSALFRPRAIAVLGASGRPGNPFARPLTYLVEHGFAGAVYPVNPGYQTLEGLTCYPSLDDLPGEVDLVLMLVSASEVVRLLPAVARAGAKAAVVFASGFAETGPDGQALQEELVRLARHHGVRLLGPNCQGLLAVHDHVVASFTAALELGVPEPGNIAYIGQSGAVGGSIFSLARERGLRIGTWASTGNQADLGATEIANFLVEDPRIQVLTMYLESPVPGAEFDRLTARAAELGKTILVLRSALSGSGARAATSHTGAIIGDDAAFTAMCRERGVVQADDVEDFIATAHALSVLPRSGGHRLGIITTSGGAGSLAADQAEARGMTVDDLTEPVQRRLARVVPDFGAVTNPVDVTAQMFKANETDGFIAVCDELLADPTVDSVLVVLTMVTGDLATSMAHGLCGLWARATKPVVVVWLAARQQTAEAREILRANGMPVYDSPRMGVGVLHALATSVPMPSQPLGRQSDLGVGDVLSGLRGGVITEHEGAEVLTALGIDRPRERLVSSVNQAADAARALGGPLVMKIQSPEVVHKTERGGVRLGVGVGEAATVYSDLVDRFTAEGTTEVLVQEQVAEGPELLVGITNTEPGFPPLLTVGMGGVTTELYQDTTTRLAPVDARAAKQMLLELKAAPLLTGFRGREGHDLDAAAEAIATLSRLAVLVGDRLAELEVNPLRLVDAGKRAIALDFLLRLGPLEETTA